MTTKQKSQIMNLLRNFFNDFRRKNIDIKLPKKTITLIMNDIGSDVLDYCFIREKAELKSKAKNKHASWYQKYMATFSKPYIFEYKNWLVEKINKKFGNEIIAYLEGISKNSKIKMGDIRDRKDFWDPISDVDYLDNIRWCYKKNNKVYSFKALNSRRRKNE